MRKILTTIAVGFAIATAGGVQAEEARLLRFPDIHQDRIVFSHGGDLWTVAAAGGRAERLTSHEGLELFARFSPDGSRIAFTGEYDGDMNVFVMPTAGGEPKRLSYHPGRSTPERFGPECIVMDWTPDGSRILYRSRQASNSIWEGKLYLVDPEGGYPQPLPLPRGGFSSFSADGRKIAYTPIVRDFRTWKRYKGGTAQDVWIYDLANARSERLTDWEGTDNVPMWDHASGRIYYNSDRTGTLNLFCYDPATKATTQVTDFTEFDVRWPSIGPGAIVFESGGYLYVMDLPDGTPRKITVELSAERLLARPRFVDCKDKVRDYTLSPDANRAIFTARGEIFTVPAKKGNTRNLTNTPGVHEKYATMSPDSRWIAYVSDRSGEDELYLIEPSGNGEPVRLTTDGSVYLYQPTWSPDSKMLSWSDKSTNVWYMDIEKKTKIKVDAGKRGDVRYQAWSPDSRWIAYSKNNEHQITQIWVYSLKEKRARAVTAAEFDDFRPVFDPEGQYLYFLSNRAFNPILGNYEFNFILDKMTEIYAIVLSADSLSPFAPESDEIKAKEDDTDDGDEDKKDGDKDEDTPSDVVIDFDGILDRQVKFPIEPGLYGGLAAVKGRIFYSSSPLRGLDGPIERTKRSIHVFDLEDREDHVFLEDYGGAELTPDGKKMIFSKGGKYEIIDATGDKAKTGENVLDLGKMKMRLDPRAEWRQIFEECWRLERDYFYDTLYHGIDWQAMHDRYSPLVDHVAHRFDLTYVIGEMLGELATGHTYVGGGEMPNPDGAGVGLLGNDWQIDSAAGRFQIGRILAGQNWIDDRRSPLTEPGIQAGEDDYVLAINGKPLSADDNPYRLLENTAGDVVSLTLSETPDGKNSRTVEVRTLSSEGGLRYYDWVVRKERYTDSVSEGRIGYVHIPNMGGAGLKQFTSTYYAQLRKPGMIIDVRWNGGGFVSQLIIERLRRVLGGMGMSRNFEPYTYPAAVYHGHLACLLNEHSASDGDIFPYHFRKYGLGPLIGKRTWGGVVGIRGHRPLLDGGYVFTPEFAKYDLDRHWVMENYGVAPDIEVEYPPEIVQQGGDPQIDRAVEELLNKIRTSPRTIPDPPATPPDER